MRFDNDAAGLAQFAKWLKSFKVTYDDNTMLVIENTGIYHRLLWGWCSKKNLNIHIGNAAHIKWSFGIARGKNDKIDSVRLCQYAFKEADNLKAAPALDPVLLQLKDLMTARTKLLTQRNSIRTFIKELKCKYSLCTANTNWIKTLLSKKRSGQNYFKGGNRSE